MPDHVIRIAKLRESLGWAYLTVANTDDPVIIQRYSRKDVVMVPLWEWQFLKELEATTLQRAETIKERDQLRRWSDRNLHEAALTEWPHMKRNYQEDAEDQQERAQLLDDNLVEIERAIVHLEERERELRERLLEP